MPNTIFSIVETAYRATVEEQDDPALWFTAAVKNAGGDIALLLRANAVNYAVKGQDASDLAIGGAGSRHPPDLAADLQRMLYSGVTLYVLAEDVIDRGIPTSQLIDGIHLIKREALPKLMSQFDQIWHW